MRWGIALALAASACGEGAAEPPPPGTPLVLVPDRVDLVGPGAGRALAVYVRTGTGGLARVAPSEVASSVLEGEGVAFLSGGARIRGGAPGTARLELRSGAHAATLEVHVEPGRGPFGAEILAHARGRGDGFGLDRLPDVVLGPPMGGGAWAGSTDTLSLGIGGAITLGFGGLVAYDGPGPDLLVFENAFRIVGASESFTEPGEVEVDAGGAWRKLPCCAGLAAVLAGPNAPDLDPTDPAAAGGDAFDLAGLWSPAPLVQAIRITDVGTSSATGTNSGFDLDAVALVHAWPAGVSGLSAEPARLQLAVGDEVPLPRVDALRPGGAPLAGVVALARAEPAGVLETDQLTLRARRSGLARIHLEAGPFVAVVEVEVSP